MVTKFGNWSIFYWKIRILQKSDFQEPKNIKMPTLSKPNVDIRGFLILQQHSVESIVLLQASKSK